MTRAAVRRFQGARTPDFANQRLDESATRAFGPHVGTVSLLVKQRGVQSFPWPLRAHDWRDVWAWEAGYCEPSFVFPFEAMPNSLDLDYGSEESSRAMCRKNQGEHPRMVDYHRVQRVQ